MRNSQPQNRVIEKSHSWKRLRYAEELYGDTYLLVSPFLCYLKTSDASLIRQITIRRDDFVKPVATYKVIDILGGNIVTAEGEDWKRQKKIVGPSFSERSNRLVWEESLRQTKGLLGMWKRKDGVSERGDGGFRVEDPRKGCALLSLHVICAAGFGVPQLWPGQNKDLLEGNGVPGFSGDELREGHTLSMKDALTGLLRDIYWFALPSEPGQLSI
jgi:cytochrome P450